MRGLYAIIDPDHCAGRSPSWVTEQVLCGGCAAVQLRAKHLSDREHLSLAHELRALCHRAAVPFWMNDRLDLAMLVEADGLHLGQHDVSPREARKLWGSRLLGLSTHSLSEAMAASVEGVDLIGFGPVYATRSKQDAEPEVGLSKLGEVLARVRLPVVAIGGIGLAHIPDLLRAGAKSCAVLSALCTADDPALTAHKLQAALVSDQ